MEILQHTLKSLDWDDIKNWVRGYIYTPPGLVELEREVFVAENEEVSEKLELLTAYIKLVEKFAYPPFFSFEDVSGIFAFLERGGEPEFEDFRFLRDYFVLLRDLKNYFLQIDFKDHPLLKRFSAFTLFDLSILQHHERIFYPSGEMREDASPQLQQLIMEKRKVTENARKLIQDLLQKNEWQHMVQDEYFTVRENRYVIPLKRNFVGRVKGIVHGLSSTGNTAYFEPDSLFSLNNRIQTIEDDIEREKKKILMEYQQHIISNLPQIMGLYDLLGKLDFLNAKAKFSIEINGIRPEIWKKPEVRIVNARHPLLIRKGNVVPNSIFMTKEKPGLIITGPNAGGKTVFLKTIGLLHLMLMWGLFIPAEEGSATFIPSSVMAEIGDYQSIGEDASTFSWHLRMCDIFYKNAGKGSLILIDEIMMGTDQEEGSFLAMSFLKGFVEKGSFVAVTTHYSYLKMLPMVDNRFIVARVDFDLKVFRPLYRVIYNSPGMSFPLEIAKFLGVTSVIIERAERLKEEYGSEAGNLFSSLVKELEKAKEKREAIEKELDNLRIKKDKLEEEYESRIKTLEEEKQREKEKLREKVLLLEKEIRNALSKFQREKTPRVFTKPGENIKKTLSILDTPVRRNGEPPEVGDLAEYVPLGITGEVVEMSEGRVKIIYKGKEFIGKKGLFRKVAREKIPPQKNTYSTKPAGMEKLDLRGMRLEEAVEVLEQKINELVIKNFSGKLIVIHGHGTGILKKGVRHHLKEHPLIEDFRPGKMEEGGDGVTVIEF